MNRWVTVGALGLVLALAAPVQAGGGNATFRIFASGDFGAVALSSYCPQPMENYEPDFEPNPTTDPPGTGLRLPGQCFVVKNNFGYDGFSGAGWCTAPEPDTFCAGASDHLGHDFTCAVTNSATPGLESISVGFDTDDDNVIDISYPNTVYRPISDTAGVDDHTLANDGPAGGVDLPDNPTGVPEADNNLPNRVNPGLNDGFVITGVIRGHFWPVVEGTIDGDFAVIFDHLGLNIEVGCAY